MPARRHLMTRLPETRHLGGAYSTVVAVRRDDYGLQSKAWMSPGNWLTTCNDFAIGMMDVYQHDRAAMFRFDLRGELTGSEVQSLEHAWNTAKSILGGKEFVVEVSGVTNVDSSGVDLLSRMRAAGARLTADATPKSKELARSLGLPVTAPRERFADTMALALLRLIRL